MWNREGGVFQICYLVDALEPALAYWTGTLGIGPFFVLPPRRFEWLIHADRPARNHAINAGLALGYSGDTQIELIVPGPAPSPYRDFLAAGGRGVHHLGFGCRNFELQRKSAIESGLRVVLEGASSLARFAYLEGSPPCPGTLIELIELNDAIEELFARIKAASLDWDGSDPIRYLEADRDIGDVGGSGVSPPRHGDRR